MKADDLAKSELLGCSSFTFHPLSRSPLTHWGLCGLSGSGTRLRWSYRSLPIPSDHGTVLEPRKPLRANQKMLMAQKSRPSRGRNEAGPLDTRESVLESRHESKDSLVVGGAITVAGGQGCGFGRPGTNLD